ncbi:glycoside hydrolase family 3 C-terminal domain-containing protein [Conexibacter stalactiti]|uniref:Glycoside hydrolase family 3 C-terminal domain-containing protein n=1 Tax=Conexibacter stalactiti TaxID=1940611 RepID=A0ABU4HNV0_9ACTN|nr:glycoside hydrolase family 3 C-terminal domain-containing protein [Conexibacter stalactiti]MDW5594215.1 glycoside hydrolase family 3 C-terminal domain-containing protein [Conexibacter stalactiti]MEC5034857.1 glycoside hydrolase family 3 C-terminal domain-containing protein [Conexibacter stalactiti]
MPGTLGRLAAVFGATVALLLTTFATAHAQSGEPWRNTSLSPDRRADLLSDAMTLEQKLRLFVANPSPPSPELGIPSRKEKDGCCGISLRTDLGVPTTSLPKGVALASTFSGTFARRFGFQIGQESWHTGFAGSTAPTADLVRSPHFGRQGESFGEDPLLGGRLPAGVVRGVQRQPGVYSLAKHYIGNYQETARSVVNEVLDERTLRELYGRQWEIIVKQGDPGAAMCAFQRVNGTYACASRHLLTDVLKVDWEFPGWVSSDFNACPDYGAFEQGADVCAPDLGTLEGLAAAVAEGTISAARLDDMVHRVLRTFFAQGVYDNPPPGTLDTPSQDLPAGQVPDQILDRGERLARTIAREGAVLLKNEGDALPLAEAEESIAVIGPDADWYIDMFGSPFVPNPARLTTLLEGIEDRAGGDVSYTPGADPTRYGDTFGGPAPVPSGVLRPADGSAEQGLNASWYIGFRGDDPQGDPFLARVEDQVNLRTGTGGLTASFGLNPSQAPLLPLPLIVNPVTATWEGTLTPAQSGTYQLGMRAMGSFRVFVDGQELIARNQVTLDNYLAPIELQAGESYAIRIVYRTDGPSQCCGPPRPNTAVRFAWVPPSAEASPQIEEAVEAARDADVAVVVANTFEGEDADRHSLQLPQDQDRLISAVAEANPNTVVVLLNGGPVTMPWLDDVPAVLEAWFPGEAQGRAVADLLFGDVSPSGKLPVTFPATEDQPEQLGIENPSLQFGNEDPTTVFDEGIFIGYRGYDERGLTPLFPFGHGLSYTEFGYSRLQVSNPRLATRSRAGRDGRVRVLVRNEGERTGTEIVQVYHGELPAQVDTPPRQLLGWARVTLRPGQQRWATIPVRLGTADHLLSYWRTTAAPPRFGAWVTPSGSVPIYVGASSRDIRQQGTMTVR